MRDHCFGIFVRVYHNNHQTVVFSPPSLSLSLPSLFPHRSTDQLMLTKVFTTHPRNAVPQCCLTVDYNSDSCPLNETGSGAGSLASSAEKSSNSSVRNGPSLTTKSLQQVRSTSPGKAVLECVNCMCVCGGGGWVWVCLRVCTHYHLHNNTHVCLK